MPSCGETYTYHNHVKPLKDFLLSSSILLYAQHKWKGNCGLECSWKYQYCLDNNIKKEVLAGMQGHSDRCTFHNPVYNCQRSNSHSKEVGPKGVKTTHRSDNLGPSRISSVHHIREIESAYYIQHFQILLSWVHHTNALEVSFISFILDMFNLMTSLEMSLFSVYI